MNEERSPGIRFSITELSGAFGDFGTIIPLILGVAVVCHLSLAPMLLFLGIWYIVAGLYYRLPVPIEPMKAIAVIAIAESLTQDTIAAAGIVLGLLFIVLGFGSWLSMIERWIPRSVIRGVQLGLAFLLLRTTWTFLTTDLSFFVVGTLVVLMFLILRYFTDVPDLSAIMIVVISLAAGLMLHGVPSLQFIGIPTPTLPSRESILSSLTLLVLPQALLTLTNAILATVLLLKDLFHEDVPPQRLSRMIGVMNLISVPFGGFPICHGAGGLAGQYRFGARTGGSNIYAGSFFVVVALFFASQEVIEIIPVGFYGVLLLFAALELGKHGIQTSQLPVTLTIATLALIIGMTPAFLIGLILAYLFLSVERQKREGKILTQDAK